MKDYDDYWESKEVWEQFVEDWISYNPDKVLEIASDYLEQVSSMHFATDSDDEWNDFVEDWYDNNQETAFELVSEWLDKQVNSQHYTLEEELYADWVNKQAEMDAADIAERRYDEGLI